MEPLIQREHGKERKYHSCDSYHRFYGGKFAEQRKPSTNMLQGMIFSLNISIILHIQLMSPPPYETQKEDQS